jgi:hypothetical protein
MRIITRKVKKNRLDNDMINNYANPDDYRFSKDTYIREADPAMNRLNDRMGTPSHIEYLKMSEEDSRRHKARCAEYDHKTGKCMCVESPNFIMKCCGSARCDYYLENLKKDISLKQEEEVIDTQEKQIVKVIPKDVYKERKCPVDGTEMIRDVIEVTYIKKGEFVHNKLTTYRCDKCEKNYIVDDLYKTYTANKKRAKLSVKFMENKQ